MRCNPTTLFFDNCNIARYVLKTGLSIVRKYRATSRLQCKSVVVLCYFAFRNGKCEAYDFCTFCYITALFFFACGAFLQDQVCFEYGSLTYSLTQFTYTASLSQLTHSLNPCSHSPFCYITARHNCRLRHTLAR